MRGILVLAWALAACGDPSLAERIDALRAGGARYAHQLVPAPARRAELSPDADEAPGSSFLEHVREDENARAILDLGPAAEADLVRLLDDPERRTLAAFFLAEIGGERGAAALLAKWRALRGDTKTKSVYLLGDGAATALGYRHEGVEPSFYGELDFALCYAGRPVSAAIASDTAAAMTEGEDLAAAGEPLFLEETREEGEDRLELRWSVEPIETACEGLRLLAMVGAPEAPPLYDRALRSPVHAFRWTAVQNALYIGKPAERLLPALAGLFDDARLGDEALEAVAFLVDRGYPGNLDEAGRAAARERYRERLRELGHLPR
jgi:hypothetical protein